MQKFTATLLLLAASGVGQNAFAAADKVTICHKGVQTAAVAAPAVSAHQQHGDTLGECGSESAPADTMAAVVMMRCEPQDGSVVVIAASSSPSPAIESGIAPGDNCAVVLGDLIDESYGLRSVTTGSAGDNPLHLYTDYLLLGKKPAVPAP